jgi:hypothetical protein
MPLACARRGSPCARKRARARQTDRQTRSRTDCVLCMRRRGPVCVCGGGVFCTLSSTPPLPQAPRTTTASTALQLLLLRPPTRSGQTLKLLYLFELRYGLPPKRQACRLTFLLPQPQVSQLSRPVAISRLPPAACWPSPPRRIRGQTAHHPSPRPSP